MPVRSGEWSIFAGAKVYYASSQSPRAYIKALMAVRGCRPQVVYLNGLLNLHFSVIPALLALVGFWRGARIVLAPRGELNDGALALKSFKKRLFLAAAKCLRLYNQIEWHASSPLEAAEISQIFRPNRPIWIHENESLVPPSAARTDSRSGLVSRVVFISRLSPKKGVHVLLEALRNVTSPLRVDIYGDAEDPRYLKRCEELAESAGAEVEIHFHGAIPPTRIRGAFAEGDAFFFPTAGENFGHVIAEALSAGCPVFACDVTPWTNHIAPSGGLVADLRPESWGSALQHFAEESPDARAARRLGAADAFDAWAAVAGTRPSFLDVLSGTHVGTIAK